MPIAPSKYKYLGLHLMLTPELTTLLYISIVRFPIDPLRKIEWVKAVRRVQAWIPRKHSKICSIHFEPECFNKSATKQKKLNEDAIPTLNLPEFSHEDKIYARVSENTDKAKNEEAFSKPSTPVNLPESHSEETKIQDLPRERRLIKKIQEKNRIIKRLQYLNRRLKKKLAGLQEVLDLSNK